VEAMGGSVVVERAALGSGTRVTMCLPLAGPLDGPPPLEAVDLRRVR
jgi:hypothetical protein